MDSEYPPSGRITETGGFIPSGGEAPIEPGDRIHLHFAGGPSDMPEPWLLIKAEDKFTTVSWSFQPSITVRAANGVERTFDNATVYSPTQPMPSPTDHPVVCRSGLRGTRCRLRDNYRDLEEYQAYDETWGLAARQGFETAEAAWEANPWIEFSVQPGDARSVPDEEANQHPIINTNALASRFADTMQHHGEESGPNYVIGDIQQVLAVAFAIMTPQQRIRLMEDQGVRDVFDNGYPEDKVGIEEFLE